MRAAVALTMLALLGTLTAFALPHAGRAANPKLTAAVNDDYTISLKDSDGNPVTSLSAGVYDIEVHDNSSFHNFHLAGPGVDEATTVPEITTVTWTVTLSEGSYHFVCDAHPSFMKGDFTVTPAATTSTTATTTTGTTATTTTGTTTVPTTTTTTTTTAPTTTRRQPPKRRRCRVPRVVGAPLSTARRRITHASCRVGKVSHAHSRRGPNRVLAQHPAAGTRLAPGGRVDLVVSLGRARVHFAG